MPKKKATTSKRTAVVETRTYPKRPLPEEREDIIVTATLDSDGERAYRIEVMNTLSYDSRDLGTLSESQVEALQLVLHAARTELDILQGIKDKIG